MSLLSATLGKWAGAQPSWFVFRAAPSDDAKTGMQLGRFGVFLQLNRWND